MVDSGLYKVCDYAGYLIVVDNDISVHCSFSESGPIVGNFHRALVSRLSSGHRCFFGDFSNFCLNCFLQDFMFIMFFLMDS